MLVGKKNAKSPVKKVSYVGTIVVRGRERKLYKGQKGGLFYRSKGVKVYVDKKTASREYRKKRVAAKRVGIMKFGKSIPNIKAIKRGLSSGISSTGIFSRTNTRDRHRKNILQYQKGKNINVSRSTDNLKRLYNTRLSNKELPNIVQQKIGRV